MWEEHCVLDDQADEILYAYSKLEEYGCPVTSSNLSYEVNVTSGGPVSASDVSKEVTLTSGLPLATKVFNTKVNNNNNNNNNNFV